MSIGVQSVGRLRFVFLLRGFLLLSVFAVVFAVPTLRAASIQVEGQRYVDLGTAAKRFGMQGYWLRGYDTVRMKSRWTTVDVDKNSRFLKINGAPILLGFSSKMSGGRLFIAESDYRHILQSVLTPQVFSRRPQLRRIVIDPGHGGRDSGAENKTHGLDEKSLNIDVALRLRTLLQQAGYEVVLTRTSDVYVSLAQRSAIANRAQADLFISIHFNAAQSKAATGIETFAMTPRGQPSSGSSTAGKSGQVSYAGNANDPWNMLAAFHLQNALTENYSGPNRGVKRGRLAVLKNIRCPGALVELGFVSNGATAQQLRSSQYRQVLASNLAEGVAAYGRRLQRIR